MTQAARLVATHTARFLQSAESSARLGPTLVAERRLDPNDFHAVEVFVLGVLRAHPELTWVSYGDRDDRFVGARRAADGDIYINKSFPVGERLERIRLEEDQLLANGLRVPFRRAEDNGYRPGARPSFRRAAAHRNLPWTEPYEFYSSGGPGLTCAMPLLDAAGAVRGVFTVDFSLARLAEFLDEVEVSPHGRVLIAARDGRPLVEQRRRGTQGVPAIPAAALA